MAGRYSQWRRLRGDLDRPELVDYGKRLLAYLDNQRKLSGNMSAAITRHLPDGSVVMARFNGDQPELYVQGVDGGEGVEDTVLLYIGSSDGLLIYSLNSQSLFRSVIGVEDYELVGVSDDGNTVFMVGGGYSLARIDLAAMEAFNGPLLQQAFTTPNTYADGGGQLNTGVAANVFGMSAPDGSAVVLFAGATARDDGVLKEALGGAHLLDGETLQPRRSAIRINNMRGQTGCWSPDSKAFYLAAAKFTDDGDAPWLWQDDDPQPEGVVKFSADGALLAASGALQTTDYQAGFGGAISGVQATMSTVFVVIGWHGTFNPTVPTLYALDAETLAVRHSLPVSTVSANVSISVAGDSVYLFRSLGATREVWQFEYSKDDGFSGPAVSANSYTWLHGSYRYESLATDHDLHPIKPVPPAPFGEDQRTEYDSYVVTLPATDTGATQFAIQAFRTSDETFGSDASPIREIDISDRSLGHPRNFGLVRRRMRKAA